MCRENLIHAIRKIKANKGFNTIGVDGIKGNELLQRDAEEIFETLKRQFEDYEPSKIRRVYIPKKNGKKRPLGIPTVTDKIIQSAIANIIEPILEGKFYEHSYGFRPMRSIEHVYAYLSVLVNSDTKRHWIVEGDIKGFFDNVDHNILIDKLYKYGIRDKRVLMIIKKILKAGIEGINERNELGTPQGGTLSPLLANVYLTDFDKWVDNQWRNFKPRTDYKRQDYKVRKLKETNLKQGYLIRYADDWIIITDSEEAANKWKYASKKFLKDKLNIELSEEKTKVTDLTKDKMSFLGIVSWTSPGSKGKMTFRSKPDEDSLKPKLKEVYKAMKAIRNSSNNVQLTENIMKYNSIVRGINNFYRITTLYNVVLAKEEWKQRDAQNRTISKTIGKRVPYKNCPNLYEKYNGKTIGFKIEGTLLGLERLGIGKFKPAKIKAQWINPYNAEGRRKYEEITGKRWQTFARNPWLTLGNISTLIAKTSRENKIYNLEYFINRPMAYNRDKGKCRICGKALSGKGDTEIHHIDKTLPLDKINKLNNLVTTCNECHEEVHKLLKRKKKKSTPKAKTINTPQKPRSSVKPCKEKLLKEIKTMPMTKVAKIYGVSDNAVRKWARGYDIYDERMIKFKTKSKC